MFKKLLRLPKRFAEETWFTLRQMRKSSKKGLIKNPSFLFALSSLVLVSLISSASAQYTSFSTMPRQSFLRPILNTASAASVQGEESLFSSLQNKIALETPDLKIIQGNTISGIAVPSLVSVKVLGDTFGVDRSNSKEIIDYTVQPGDTYEAIAAAHNISLNTLLWANELTGGKPKAGDSLVILPSDGVLHVVKEGDTMPAIAQKYKAKAENVIAFNDLANQDDMYVGDILVVPGGVLPAPSKKAPAVQINIQVPLADNYFIFPVQGRISQGLHYFNGVDIANSCGTPVYAAAAGVVQRAVFNGGYNQGMGNHITILHSNGTVTYYGHLSSVLVKPGQQVDVGQNIGLVGRTGKATGCHLHFQVLGARNPLAGYAVGATISYKK